VRAAGTAVAQARTRFLSDAAGGRAGHTGRSLEKLLAKSPAVCALPAYDAETQFYSARWVKNLETDILAAIGMVRAAGELRGNSVEPV
jgi:hypothetical protein